MKVFVIVLSLVIVLLAVIGLIVIHKYLELKKDYNKTREWGFAMRDKAAEYLDLYNNLQRVSNMQNETPQPDKNE